MAESAPVSDLETMLRTMEPTLHDAAWAFVFVPPSRELPPLRTFATVEEDEGTTLILLEDDAHRATLDVRFRAARITLTVHSALAGIGLTAAFARALADVGISANVVAAVHHDHIFVPYDEGPRALAALRALQSSAGG